LFSWWQSSDRQSAFLSKQNVFNMLSQWAPAGIMAVGMTFVILTGGFDLSVASGYSLCAVVAAYVGQSYPPSIAFGAAILVGLLFGLATVSWSQWSASIPSSPRLAAALSLTGWPCDDQERCLPRG